MVDMSKLHEFNDEEESWAYEPSEVIIGVVIRALNNCPNTCYVSENSQIEISSIDKHIVTVYVSHDYLYSDTHMYEIDLNREVVIE